MWRKALSLLPLTLMLFVAQTEQAANISSELSKLMMPLVTVIILVIVPVLVFKAIVKGVLEKI